MNSVSVDGIQGYRIQVIEPNYGSMEEELMNDDVIGSTDANRTEIRRKNPIRRFFSSLGHLKRSSYRRAETRDVLSDASLSTPLIIDDDAHDPITSDGENDNDSFFKFFLVAKGPIQIIFLCMMWSLALGSTVGVTPSVMTDQYAKIYHDFDHDDSCRFYTKDDKPQACIDGSSDAQTAAASSNFVTNLFTFLTSSLIGSISDEYGRRNLLVLGEFLSVLGPLFLVLIQIFPSMNPSWYYVASSAGGLISWITIALSSLSDVMPKKWRAPTFGLLLSGFSLGFALSPFLALGFSHYGVSLLSLSLLVFAFLFSIFKLPETLPEHVALAAQNERNEYHQRPDESSLSCFGRSLVRPMKELSILNRNNFFRLLSALAFFSGMSSAADQTLLVYYVEDRLDFNDHDIAILFGLIGLLGIFVQGFMLKPLTDLIGERFVVVVAFASGVVTNGLYSFATTKGVIFLAVCVGSIGGISFPTISAMKANNAEEFEQGRIQGALYALSSLAAAIGPVILRAAYEKTKTWIYPGSFFLVASAFFVIATFCGLALPKDKANSTTRGDGPVDESSIEG